MLKQLEEQLNTFLFLKRRVLRARPPQEVKVCEQGNVEAWASTRSVKLSAMFRHISQEALNCRKCLPEARVIPKACPFLKLFFWDGWACVWVALATQEMWTGDPKRRACKRPASASSQVAKDNKQQKTTSSSTSSAAGSSSDAVETEEEEGGDEEEAAVEAGDEKADAKYEAKDQQKKPSPGGPKTLTRKSASRSHSKPSKSKDQNRRKTSSRKRPPNQSPNPSQSPSPSPSCSPSCRQRPRQPSRQRQCLAGSTKAARQQVDQIRVNAARVRVAEELLQGPHAIQFLGALFAFSF